MWSNATTSFNDKIQEYSRTFKARLVLADASTVGISTLTYTNGITGADTFTLGGAVSSMITGTIVEEMNKSLKGQEVTLQIGVEVTPEQFEYIPMGIYKITASPALDGGGVSFTAYDAMYYKYSAPYVPTSGLGETITETSTDEEGNEVVTTTTIATIGQVLADIESQLGIRIANSCNTALMTSKVRVLGGCYYAETLGYLASALGGFVYVDRVGVVTIAPLGSRGSFQIDGDRYYNLTKGEENTVIDGVIVSTGGNDYQYGRGARVTLSNPILLEASAEAMANAIIGTEYRPVTVSFLGDVRLDSNDTLTIITPSGENYTTPIMQISHTFDGGVTTTVTSYEVNEVESEVGFTGSITQQLERTQMELVQTTTMVAQKADIKELNVVKGTIEELDAKVIRTGELVADKATIGELNVVKADIKELNANVITTNEIVATKASITELNTAKADIKVLEADSAKINSLIFGNAVGGTISADFATAIVGAFQNGIIKSAMIESLAVEKISGGTISTKKFRVSSDDGNLVIADNTIQIKDGTRVRIQIGKDSTGDYNLGLWDANGKKIWDAKGITADGIRDGLIDNDMINDNANISGDKLNLPSLVKEINDSTETIKASHILYDPTKQTLDIAFQSMSKEVGNLSGNVSTLQTNHSVMNGQIKTVISATETLDRELGTVADDVATAMSKADTANATANNANTTASNANKTATTANNTANTAKATADSAKATSDSANATATTAKNTADTAKNTADTAKNTATSALTKVTTVETSLNGFKTQVSETYTTKTDFNNLQIGGKNLLLKSDTPATNNIYNIHSYKCTELMSVGQTYTITACVTPASKVTHFDAYVSWGETRVARLLVSGTSKQIVSKTFVFNGYDSSHIPPDINHKYADVKFYRFPNDNTVTTNSTIHWVKLEKGNKATDWTPAPEEVQTNIDNIQVGGRNLIEKSFNLAKWGATMNSDSKDITTSHEADYTRITFNGNAHFGNAYYGNFNTTQAREKGQTYTVSFDVKLSNICTGCVFYWYENERGTQLPFRMDKVNAWERKTFTYTKTSETSSGTFLMGFKLDNPQAGTTLDVRNIKFETGNRATDWIPAPEDVQTQIDTSLTKLDDMASDSKLTPQEKISVKTEWTVIANEYSKYITQANGYKVSTTAYTNAYNTLNTYLNGTNTGIIFNMSTTTNISRDTFNNNFKNYYGCRTDLENAIATAKAKYEADNVQVGGRNLLRNSMVITHNSNHPSKYPISSTKMTEGSRTFHRIRRTNTTSEPTVLSIYNAFDLNKEVTESIHEKEITISFKIRASHNTKTNLYASVTNPEYIFPFHGNETFDITTNWRTISKTFTMPVNTNGGNRILRFCPYQITIPSGQIDNFYFDICEYKIEFGNKATDWSPAPEDVNASIATVDGKFTNYTTTTELNSKLTQTKNEISTEVSGKYTTKAEYTTGIADVNKKFGSYTTTADLNTKLTQTKEQIKLEASETYTTKTDFNNLKVGGRNILLKSNVEVANNNFLVKNYKVSELLVTGEVYTLTVCVTPAPKMTHFTPHTSTGYSGVTTLHVSGTTKQVVSSTFKFNGYADGRVPTNPNDRHADIEFYRYPNNNTITGNTTIHWVKLEKGNKATDWTPAHEDTESTISTLRSSITANANAIELKVSKGDIISSINQTAESVKINASKIDLQGYVTVSALSGSGTTTINGANIKTGAIQSSNYVANSAGTKINLSDGTIDTKGFKVNSAGVATLTGATLTNVDLKFTSNGEDVGRIYSYAGGGGFPTLSISGQYGLDLSSNRGVRINGGSGGVSLGDAGATNVDVIGTTTTKYLRITSTHDASETSTGHGLQIGADNTSNIRIDPNEIVVCNNGALSEFYLNAKSIGLHANVNCKGILQSTGGDVRVKNGDNTARLGKGDNDVFIHNSASGKYLQLKDSGALQYSGTDVILASHFTGTKNTNGYVKLPNGLIIQWGSLYMTCTTGGTTVSSTVTFPVKFSSACYQIVTAVAGGVPHICSTSASDYSTSNFKYHLNRTNTTQTSCRWIAIGS